MSSNHPPTGPRGAPARLSAPRASGPKTVAGDGHGAPARAPVPGTPSDEYAGTSLRLQVLEIIDSLLNSTGPELEELRVRLRGHLKEHPWNPETALLLYLWEREGDLTSPPGFGPNPGPVRSAGPPAPDQAGC